MSSGIVGHDEEPIYASSEESVSFALWRRRRGTTNAEDGLHLGEVRPGVRASKHLDDETPKGPYVGLACVTRLLDNLRCHPINTPLEARSVNFGSRKQIVVDALRDAKVGDLNPALVVDEYVGALDVAVDDLARVEVLESGEDLAHEL